MTNENANIPRNETYTWLEPGAWRKPCIVHVTMVANSRQTLFDKLTHNGAVTYTAAISKGEQKIAKVVREKGFPLVVLLNDGFPAEGSPQERFYKPGGVYFEACSRGKLLLIEPDGSAFVNPVVMKATEETLQRKAEAKHHSYRPIPVESQRYRFVAMNEIGRLLVER